jgi:hypothetical protein
VLKANLSSRAGKWNKVPGGGGFLRSLLFGRYPGYHLFNGHLGHSLTDKGIGPQWR